MEKAKLEKLAAKGFSAEEAKKAVEGHPDAHPEAVKAINETATSGTTSDATSGAGANYGLIAGVVGAAALGYWYFSSSSKKDDK